MQQKTLTVTVFQDAVLPNTPANVTMVIPNGYGKLKRFLFNPQIDYEITVRSQKSKINILDQFRTPIGTFGMLDMPSDELEDDRFIITLTNRETTNENLFLTGVFEEN